MNERSEENKKMTKRTVPFVILALAAIVVVISWPVLFMDMAKGHDLLFHLERIEGIASDASWTNLPVKMQSGWMNGYGYPVSILYGDIFLYVGAVFRKIGLPVMPAFRLFMVCVNTATVVIAYFSFKVFNKGWAAVLATAAYATASYRLVDAYVRSAIGETLAIVFFPGIAAAIWLIYTEEDAKKRWKYSVILALCFSAVIFAHTITTSMLLVVLVLFCPVSLLMHCKKPERLGRILNIAVSGLLTVLLSLFFVVPFLDFFLNADIAFALDNKNNIEGAGPGLYELFEFICNPFRDAAGNIQRTPGPVLIGALIFALVYIIVSSIRRSYMPNHRRIVFETVASLILLYMSSSVFPWNFVEDNIPHLGSILTAIEFPMRYLAFAIVFLSLLTGDLLYGLFAKYEEDKKTVLKRVIISCVSVICVLCIANVTQLCIHSRTYEKRADYMTREDLGIWEYYAMDFALEHTNVKDLERKVINEGMLSFEILSDANNNYLIACVTGPEYGWIQLPMFNYKYYKATDLEDPSIEFEVRDGSNRCVGVLLPGNYSGIVHVFWQRPVFWRVAELISLLSFIGCMAYIIYGSRSRKAEASC